MVDIESIAEQLAGLYPDCKELWECMINLKVIPKEELKENRSDAYDYLI